MSQDTKYSIKTFTLSTLILMIPSSVLLFLWYLICEGDLSYSSLFMIGIILISPIVFGVGFTAFVDQALASGKPRMAFLSDIDAPLGILFFACFPTFIAAKIKLQDYFEGYAWIVLAGISIALIVLSFLLCIHIQNSTYADNSRGLGNLSLLGGILLCVAILVTAVFLPSTGAIDTYENYSNHTFDTSHWENNENDVDDYDDNDNDATNDVYKDVDGTVYKITYQTKLEHNHSVGNDWTVTLTYNGDRIKSGDVITLSDYADSISLLARAVESDSIDDVGTRTVDFDSMSIEEERTLIVFVTVTENNGRYTGNTARWRFEITVERIA